LPGPVFGHIPGYPVGSRFENRAALAKAGEHRHRQAGISGSVSRGADSIVLSGGYEDDQDLGNLIIYTGYGGRDPATGRQVSDQPFSLGNRALAYSSLNGLSVRVIRIRLGTAPLPRTMVLSSRTPHRQNYLTGVPNFLEEDT
jgi:putative restriction endonuclease